MTDSAFPFSEKYNDVYFSKEGGLEETDAVFLKENFLPLRWQEKRSSHFFCIGELGFGTGLNFLRTYETWKRTPNKAYQILHFLSVEESILDSDYLQTVHSQFPELQKESSELLGKWRKFPEGYHRIWFSEGVCLTLLVGDVITVLQELDARVDSWFLDGFRPSSNPQMWSLEVFEECKRLSKTGTSFATYTSSSFVKRNLEQVGFHVEKVKGFGKKREMLKGQLEIPNWNLDVKTSKPISIVGGGIGGVQIGSAFQKRNIEFSLFEKKEIGSEASGNPIALSYPYLTKFKSPQSQISITSFFYSLNEISKNAIYQKGIYFLLMGPEEEIRYQESLRNHKLDESIAKLQKDGNTGKECIYFPEACSLRPKVLLEDCTSRFPKEFLQLREFTKEDLSENSTTIFANGTSLKEFVSEKLSIVRGQISFLEGHGVSSNYCYGNYLAPYETGFWVGASYDEFHLDLEARETETNAFLENAKAIFPDLNVKKTSNSRVGFRVQTKDRFPIAGGYKNQFYLLGGLGSRGFLYSFLLAELIVSDLLGEPIPLPKSLQKFLSPERFSKEKN